MRNSSKMVSRKSQPPDWEIDGRFCIVYLHIDNFSTAISKDSLLFYVDTTDSTLNMRQCYSFTMMFLKLEFQGPVILCSGFDPKVMSIC